ncbi:OR46A protein, partial [Pseudoatta argentina]
MDIPPVNFKALRFCGAWKEREDNNMCVGFLRLCYRYTIFLLIYEFTILDVIEINRTRDHIQELTEGLFMGLTFLTLCVKYAIFLLRGNELLNLLNCLRVKRCQPRNSIEKLIIEEHSRRAKWSTMSFLMISYVTGLGFIITPALDMFKGGERVLPLKTYIPYSVSNLLPYLVTYLQQFLAVFYAIMLNVNFDCLVYGFTIQTCAQIDLMCSRLTDSLKNIGDISSASIEECVKHHLLVRNLVKKIRELFIWTVIIFFFFSLLIVCTSIFLISKKKLLSFEFLSMFLYLSGMLLQLFYYCWYENELELKSKDIATTVYSCNWTMATPRERRSLMLIMISIQQGIMFSYHGVFTLSLNTFAWVSKVCRYVHIMCTMDILPINFKALRFCGAWKERKDDNICVRFLRFCYRYTIFFLIYEFTIFDVIEVIRTRDHVQELTEGLFLGLTFLTLCVKYANFLLRESELSDLLDSLRVKMCQPRNSIEKLIIEQHSRRAKWSSILFMMISYMTGFGFMITPALGLHKGGERVLPLKTYIPYSVSNSLLYLATYLQQFLTLFYAIMLNVTFDCLVYGFTIQVCAQIELMCCRLTDSFKNSGRISSGQNRETSASIVECVKHHLLVSNLVKKIRELFIWTVMIFFFFSLLIVCTSIFLISKKKLLSFEFLSMFLYLSGMLLQLFYYCWYGNELELKSKDIATAVYSCDWTMVTPLERRSLMLIMISSQKGIMFSYHGIFALSLNTFTWICRTSYSAYNLLQQASN